MRLATLTPLLLSLPGTVHAESVDMVVYPNAGVFEVSGSRISGPGADMLGKLQAASGVQMNLQAMPIARAMQTVPHRPGSCLVALPRNPEREPQFSWAGPWATSAIGLYGRASETRRVEGPSTCVAPRSLRCASRHRPPGSGNRAWPAMRSMM